ncbi:MAG: pseudouridine synthase [Bacteroidota bacterium]
MQKDWPPFEILTEDDDLIAINKPSGILVHRTTISEDTTFVLQLLRDQIGQRIYPVHRLDRGTSGVLLFAKHEQAASLLGEQFRHREVQKTYLAVIRGYVEERATIDYPLTSSTGTKPLPSRTHYQRLSQIDYPVAIGRYPSSRLSFVNIQPETGRWHQIRRHFSHIRHPIIGDKKHGDVKHNTYFREVLGVGRLLLHASELRLRHPLREEFIHIRTDLSPEWIDVMKQIDLRQRDL